MALIGCKPMPISTSELAVIDGAPVRNPGEARGTYSLRIIRPNGTFTPAGSGVMVGGNTFVTNGHVVDAAIADFPPDSQLQIVDYQGRVVRSFNRVAGATHFAGARAVYHPQYGTADHANERHALAEKQYEVSQRGSKGRITPEEYGQIGQQMKSDVAAFILDQDPQGMPTLPTHGIANLGRSPEAGRHVTAIGAGLARSPYDSHGYYNKDLPSGEDGPGILRWRRSDVGINYSNDGRNIYIPQDLSARGDSGGSLVNESGELIGLIAAGGPNLSIGVKLSPDDSFWSQVARAGGHVGQYNYYDQNSRQRLDQSALPELMQNEGWTNQVLFSDTNRSFYSGYQKDGEPYGYYRRSSDDPNKYNWFNPDGSASQHFVTRQESGGWATSWGGTTSPSTSAVASNDTSESQVPDPVPST